MRRLMGLVLGAVGVVCWSTCLYAANVVVGTCSANGAHKPTIQAAVNFASPLDSILVCPGIYPEQVVVNKPLTLKGVAAGNANAAVIVPPAGGVIGNANSYTSGNSIAAQLLVQQTNGVTITNITVDGANNGITSCLPILIGIFFQNASGTVTRVSALNQATPSVNGCQSGLGIFVQSDGIGGLSAVTVSNSFVQNYQKNGITGNELGTTLVANGNYVIGQGPTTGAAENSIQIGFGANGSMSNNIVADDVWAPDTIADSEDAAAGLLVYDAAGVITSGNTVTTTQFGIAYVEDAPAAADNGQIKSNKISATHIFDGIDVCSDHNTVQSNTISGSDESAIHFDSSCGGSGAQGTVSGNMISASCAGILLGNLSSSLGSNSFFNVTNKLLAGDVCTPPLASVRKTAHKFKPVRP